MVHLTGSINLPFFEKEILEALRNDFIGKTNKKMPKIMNRVRKKITNLLEDALVDSTTITSLLSGKLRDDFGLSAENAVAAVTQIIDNVTKRIDLQLKKSNVSLAHIVLEISPVDEKFYKSISAGSRVSKSGESVDWLEWLLTRGSQVIIGDYYTFDKAKGRTLSGGKTIMKKIGKKSKQPFRVDPQHAGTLEDNFITRAIESKSQEIVDIFNEGVKNELS